MYFRMMLNTSSLPSASVFFYLLPIRTLLIGAPQVDNNIIEEGRDNLYDNGFFAVKNDMF